jgi:hypothetical protein
MTELLSETSKNKSRQTAGRKKKTEKYSEERQEILSKIKNILDVSDDKQLFYLHDIDTNKEKQQEILDLKDKIEVCFKSKNSAVFMPVEKQAIRPYMSLIRLVFKEMGFKIIVTRVTIYRKEESVYTSMYTINKAT